jgi:hypothetical protein
VNWYNYCTDSSVIIKTEDMKRITLSVIILLVTLAGMAQGQVPLTKQEKKALKKEQKIQYQAMLVKNTSEAIASGQFVLKADQIRGRRGTMMMVDPTINFVAVQNDETFVQLGSQSGMGYNGVGGITLRGKITSMKIDQDKKHGTYYIAINTVGTSGSLTISMRISPTGEMASATVESTWGRRVDFEGTLYAWEGTRIFKGQESF